MGKMIRTSVALAVATVAMVSLAANVSAATTLYDSQGFAAPTYTLDTDLHGQDGWQGVAGGVMTGGISGTIADQYVTVGNYNGTGAAAAWYHDLSPAAGGESVVQLNWTLSTQGNTGASFGVAIFGGTTQTQIKAVSVGPGDSGWADYQLTLDFASHQANLLINGTDFYDLGSIDPSLTGATSIALFTTGGTSGYYTDATHYSASYGFFDNVAVSSAVPEPMSLGLAAVAGSMLLGRRRASAR